jgi:hypothetical protein
MHLGFLSIACLLSSAIAAPIETAAQSTAVVDNALRSVANSLTRLDQAMKSRPYGGSVEEAAQITDTLLQLSNVVISDLRNGANDIRSRQATLGTLEGLSLVPSLTSMASNVQSVMNGWADSKKMVVAGGRYDIAVQTLFEAQDRTSIFADAIIAKVPWGEQTLAGTYKTQFTNIIMGCIKVYQSR